MGVPLRERQSRALGEGGTTALEPLTKKAAPKRGRSTANDVIKIWLSRSHGRATNLPHGSPAGTYPALFLRNPEQIGGIGNFAGDDFFLALLICNGKC